MIIGGGNTAMDCCRTSLRLGGRERQGGGAESRGSMLKASDWELEDAEEEHIDLLLNHSPVAYHRREAGKLVGMKFARVEWN